MDNESMLMFLAGYILLTEIRLSIDRHLYTKMCTARVNDLKDFFMPKPEPAPQTIEPAKFPTDEELVAAMRTTARETTPFYEKEVDKEEVML